MENIHLTARVLREDLKPLCEKLSAQILQEPASVNRNHLVLALESLIDADYEILQVLENSSYNAFPECDKFLDRNGKEENEDLYSQGLSDRRDCVHCRAELL